MLGQALRAVATRFLGNGTLESVAIKGKDLFGKLWKNNIFRRTTKIVGTEQAGELGLQWLWNKTWGEISPWLLPIAAIGGVFLMFKDKWFGKSEEPQELAMSAPGQGIAPALTPELAISSPQMSFGQPVPLGASVTTAYPATVAMLGQERAQSTPPTNWAARFSPTQPTGSYVERVGARAAAAQQSFAAAEEARAAEAAMLQQAQGF